MNPRQLNSQHQLVLRHLALGKASLKDICDQFKLNYATYQQIVNSELFQQELRRVQEKLLEQAIEQELDDPVVKELKKASVIAARRLAIEVNNCAEELGANASSRIKASESILDRLGYGVVKPRTEQASQPTVIINISQSKLDSVLRRANAAAVNVSQPVLEPVPA